MRYIGCVETRPVRRFAQLSYYSKRSMRYAQSCATFPTDRPPPANDPHQSQRRDAGRPVSRSFVKGRLAPELGPGRRLPVRALSASPLRVRKSLRNPKEPISANPIRSASDGSSVDGRTSLMSARGGRAFSRLNVAAGNGKRPAPEVRPNAGRPFSRSGIFCAGGPQLRERHGPRRRSWGGGRGARLLWSVALLCISERGFVTIESPDKRLGEYRQVLHGENSVEPIS